jgi:hypothetical protein
MSAALSLMPQTASVYTEDPTDGDFSVLATSGLRCQLAHVSGGSATTAPDRAELAAMRVLYFDPSYSLPSDHCQVEVRGERWNVLAGTVTEQRNVSDVLVYRRCDLMRAL